MEAAAEAGRLLVINAGSSSLKFKVRREVPDQRGRTTAPGTRPAPRPARGHGPARPAPRLVAVLGGAAGGGARRPDRAHRRCRQQHALGEAGAARRQRAEVGRQDAHHQPHVGAGEAHPLPRRQRQQQHRAGGGRRAGGREGAGGGRARGGQGAATLRAHSPGRLPAPRSPTPRRPRRAAGRRDRPPHRPRPRHRQRGRHRRRRHKKDRAGGRAAPDWAPSPRRRGGGQPAPPARPAAVEPALPPTPHSCTAQRAPLAPPPPRPHPTCRCQASALAPLHNPPGLAGISAAQNVFGPMVPQVGFAWGWGCRSSGPRCARGLSQGLRVRQPAAAARLAPRRGAPPPARPPQVAVFDTAFHQTLPPHAYMYALPLE
jgi:hypothetical protein